MTALMFPWLGFAMGLPLLGAVVLTFVRDPGPAARTTLGFLIAALLASLGVALGVPPAGAGASVESGVFRADDLAGPLLPGLGVLHLLALLGTSKSRISTGLCRRQLLSLAITSALVVCHSGTVFVALAAILTLLPLVDLHSRGQRLRGFLAHLGLPGVLLVLAAVVSGDRASDWQAGLLLVALRLSAGVFPFHTWLPRLFQKAGFGTALLFVMPSVEIVGFLRFLLPRSTEWMMDAASIACLVTAVYAAGMGIVQDDARRFFGFVALSQTSMMAYAVMTHASIGVTAALCLWCALVPALAGLALSIRSLEARFGPLSLRENHGYYEQVPGLAIGFLIAGLASVGFPGTVGFVPMELLISGSAQRGISYSAVLALAAMLNGIAILRAYFSLFTGRRCTTSVSLRMTAFERSGIALLAVIVFLGAWFSPALVASRHRVADHLLASRPDFAAPPTESTGARH